MPCSDGWINLDGLAEGVPGITRELAASMAHAAAVCLESQRHSPGVSLEVRGDSEASFALSWSQTTEQVRRTWNDESEATEFGACAVAVLLMLELTEWTVIERSWVGSGFDYWLGEQRSVLFQRRACLEVSGIRRGNDSDVRRRVEQKLDQVKRGSEPTVLAYVIVVEFSRPLAQIEVIEWR